MKLRILTSMIIASVAAGIAPGPMGVADSQATPLWLTHVARFPGGLSPDIRAVAGWTATVADEPARRPVAGGDGDQQINGDYEPPMPQLEGRVAISLRDPQVAIVGAWDWGINGSMVMRTSDGGASWSSVAVVPVLMPTYEACVGVYTEVAYSLRDDAFYLVHACFQRTGPASEVHLYKSTDDGATWTPGSQAAVAFSNRDSETGEYNSHVFHDELNIIVDNTPTSAHYGRVYVSTVRFHFTNSGRSDYCPLKLAYTDDVPTFNPALTAWQHTPIVPNTVSGRHIGPASNQWPDLDVNSDGVLTADYVLESCNTYRDRGIRYQRSADGGTSFEAKAIRVDRPGEFVDNPELDDILPPTHTLFGNATSQATSPTTGTTIVVYRNWINGERTGTDISYQKSDDGGTTWSSAAFLAVRPNGRPARNDQFLPALAVDGGGTFYALWYDRRRDDENRRIDAWFGVSADDGETWTTSRLSDKSFDPDRAFFSSGFLLSDELSIAASNGWIYPVWTDARHSAIERTGIGEGDIFTDIQHP